MPRIVSDFFEEGLFGQILTHLLEYLPYCEANRLRPEFVLRSRKYALGPRGRNPGG